MSYYQILVELPRYIYKKVIANNFDDACKIAEKMVTEETPVDQENPRAVADRLDSKKITHEEYHIKPNTSVEPNKADDKSLSD